MGIPLGQAMRQASAAVPVFTAFWHGKSLLRDKMDFVFRFILGVMAVGG